MDYMLRLIDVFTRFLDDGRICLGNNSAERELRGVALAHKSWLFAGSDRGSAHAAVMLTLIRTAKLNEVDPQGVLAWIADHKITDLAALLPWNWRHAIPIAGTA
jgi:transposase